MKYSDKVVGKIIKSISQGSTFDQAAEYAGISRTTFYEWKATKPDFADAVKKAEEERDDYGRELAISTIFQAMKNGVWQSGAWWLERVFPAKFKQSSNIDHTSKDDKIQGLTVEIIDTSTTINDN